MSKKMKKSKLIKIQNENQLYKQKKINITEKKYIQKALEI
jgi:hypothetical protein